MKKLIVLLLLLSMVLTVFVSCKDDTPTPPDNDREQQTGEGEVPLPEPKEEWKGNEFNIMYRDTYDYEWVFVEEDAGSVINDAIFDRNSAVEDRYDIIINPISVSNASFDNDFLLPLNNSILAGDDDFQLAAGYQYLLAYNSTLGNFLNWYDVPNVTPNAVWWDGDFFDAASYNGCTYIASGSLSLSHLYSSSCFFFNQTMIDSRVDGGSAKIFEAVKNGTWTYETFYEYASQCSADNGDDVWDQNDIYGFATNMSTALDGFLYGFDIGFSYRNNSGEIKLNSMGEKIVNVTIAVNNLINVSGHTFRQSMADFEGNSIFTGMLSTGNAAFSTGRLEDAQNLRQIDGLNYGILPYPKWDEEQKEYHSFTLDYSTAFVIPRVVEDPEFVGAITEALAYYSYEYVRDALYNTVLKYRDAKDQESSECVDLILDGARYDFAYIYANAWGGTSGPAMLFRECINGKNTYIANGFKANQERYETKLETFLQGFVSK